MYTTATAARRQTVRAAVTNHAGRVYALGLALVVFFLAWAVVAARPWSTAATDPRLKALAIREVQLRREARLVNEIVSQRWTAYRVALRARRAEIAALKRHASELAAASRARVTAYAPTPASASASASAPAPSPGVRIVTLPPLTITRTS
jgi:hypothetical protein